MEQLWRGIEVLLITLICGLVGGLARYFLDTIPDRDAKIDKASTVGTTAADKTQDALPRGRSAFLGIVAALIVPLFLKLADSSLVPKILAPETKSPEVVENFMVFAGMCILAGFSARKFMQTVSDRLLHDVERAKKDAGEAKEEAEGSEVAVADMEENLAARAALEAKQNIGREPGGGAAEVRETDLNPEELKVLNLVFRPPYSRRTRPGVAKECREAGLSIGEIESVLSALQQKNPKLVAFVRGEATGRELYELTPTGLRALEKARGEPKFVSNLDSK